LLTSNVSIPVWLLVLVVPLIASVFPLYKKVSKKLSQNSL
jgi:hypothetical protein